MDESREVIACRERVAAATIAVLDASRYLLQLEGSVSNRAFDKAFKEAKSAQAALFDGTDALHTELLGDRAPGFRSGQVLGELVGLLGVGLLAVGLLAGCTFKAPLGFELEVYPLVLALDTDGRDPARAAREVRAGPPIGPAPVSRVRPQPLSNVASSIPEEYDPDDTGS